MTGTAFSFFDIILILLILNSAFYFFNKYVEQRYVKLPPGPVGLPLVGYLPFLGDLPFKAFKELSSKYGSIFGLYMGRSYVVVLNNYESVKDAFSNPVILDRPPNFFDFHPGGLGFVSSNGAEWIEERRKEVELRKSSFENSEELVFIDGYLKLMKLLEDKNMESNFSVNSLIANSQAVIHAGSETIRTSLLWLFLGLASFPDIQKKCRDEIQGVLGKDGKCRWSDAKKLPYAYATAMEGQRWKTVTPFGLLHRARDNTKIGDFHIPRGAIVISNAWALHNDPEYWPEPEKFEPERFLLEDGTLNKKSESYIPFSLGRRNCPGESIAMMEIFRYLVSILQKYEILPLEDRLPVLEGEVGLTFYPYRQELRFISRD